MSCSNSSKLSFKHRGGGSTCCGCVEVSVLVDVVSKSSAMSRSIVQSVNITSSSNGSAAVGVGGVIGVSNDNPSSSYRRDTNAFHHGDSSAPVKPPASPSACFGRKGSWRLSAARPSPGKLAPPTSCLQGARTPMALPRPAKHLSDSKHWDGYMGRGTSSDNFRSTHASGDAGPTFLRRSLIDLPASAAIFTLVAESKRYWCPPQGGICCTWLRGKCPRKKSQKASNRKRSGGIRSHTSWDVPAISPKPF